MATTATTARSAAAPSATIRPFHEGIVLARAALGKAMGVGPEMTTTNTRGSVSTTSPPLLARRSASDGMVAGTDRS